MFYVINFLCVFFVLGWDFINKVYGTTWLSSSVFPFKTYARYFYGKKKYIEGNSSTGYYKPTSTEDANFDKAWLFHQKTQKHHWQFWILMEDDGGVKLLPMDECYWKEMLCDWYGASIATGKSNFSNYRENTKLWYINHMNIIQLNRFTRSMIEKELGVNQ